MLMEKSYGKLKLLFDKFNIAALKIGLQINAKKTEFIIIIGI